MIWKFWQWFRGKPTPQAQQALRDAQRRRQTAQDQYNQAMRRTEEAEQVTEQIRRHNAANSYDRWLADIIGGGRWGGSR